MNWRKKKVNGPMKTAEKRIGAVGKKEDQNRVLTNCSALN